MALSRIVIVEKDEDITKRIEELEKDISPHTLKEGSSILVLAKSGNGKLIRKMPQAVISEVKSMHDLYDQLKELKNYRNALGKYS